MYVNTHTIPKPPQHLLDQCSEVVIPVVTGHSPYWEMKKWCRENNTSYVWCEQVDTSDFSPHYDYIVVFYFIEAKDATMFTLKFK